MIKKIINKSVRAYFNYGQMAIDEVYIPIMDRIDPKLGDEMRSLMDDIKFPGVPSIRDTHEMIKEADSPVRAWWRLSVVRAQKVVESLRSSE